MTSMVDKIAHGTGMEWLTTPRRAEARTQNWFRAKYCYPALPLSPISIASSELALLCGDYYPVMLSYIRRILSTYKTQKTTGDELRESVFFTWPLLCPCDMDSLVRELNEAMVALWWVFRIVGRITHQHDRRPGIYAPLNLTDKNKYAPDAIWHFYAHLCDAELLVRILVSPEGAHVEELTLHAALQVNWEKTIVFVTTVKDLLVLRGFFHCITCDHLSQIYQEELRDKEKLEQEEQQQQQQQQQKKSKDSSSTQTNRPKATTITMNKQKKEKSKDVFAAALAATMMDTSSLLPRATLRNNMFASARQMADQLAGKSEWIGRAMDAATEPSAQAMDISVNHNAIAFFATSHDLTLYDTITAQRLSTLRILSQGPEEISRTLESHLKWLPSPLTEDKEDEGRRCEKQRSSLRFFRSTIVPIMTARQGDHNATALASTVFGGLVSWQPTKARKYEVLLFSQLSSL